MALLSSEEIYGNWATLLLATGKDGNIDFSKLVDEIDILIDSRPNGIYSNGTAGEFYAQNEKEFINISELLAEKCHSAGIPFQIGVCHMSPQISLSRLHAIKSLLPGAVQVILPDWFPVTMEEAVIFLKRMEEEANGIPLVLYNPPHAKKVLSPLDWMALKQQIPSLIGVKVSDYDRNGEWYQQVRENVHGLSVFIPGHNLATGILSGGHGSYSNMACLNPMAAQKWYELICSDKDAALELEQRIQYFMDKLITPFIVKENYPNHACDRFMALVGQWADVGETLRWPYRSIPKEYAVRVRKEAHFIIPEFFIA